MSSGVVPKYEELAARERLFLAFLQLVRRAASKHGDPVSRAWVLLLVDKVERAIRRGCQIDDVLDALDRCFPRDTRVVNVDQIEDEDTVRARPSAHRRSSP